MRILSNEDVAQVLTAEECLSALEVAYRELALGHAVNRPRSHSYLPETGRETSAGRYRFKSQEGGGGSTGVWALRTASEMVATDTLPDGTKRKRLVPAASGGRYCGLITLYSTTRLEPLAIIQDSLIQRMRCSATSALGMRELSRQDVRVAGLFGAGWQAQSHLDYMLSMRPGLEEVRVYSPVRSERESFAKRWEGNRRTRIVAVDDPKLAVQGCGLVTCATNSAQPCFQGEWLELGTHVTCITHPDGTVMKRELDDTTYDRADTLVVFSREQMHLDRQVDLLGSVQRGRRKEEEIGELGELLLGRCAGRSSADQITVFANNTGMGLQFAAVGARVLSLAEARGLGQVVPSDWFLESTPS